MVVVALNAFHRSDIFVVEAVRALSANADYVALVEFHPYDAAYLLLALVDKRLQRLAFRGIPEAVVD